jgi:hypothetical protein
VDRLSKAWARREVQEILKLTQPELCAEKKKRKKKKPQPRHGSKTVEEKAGGSKKSRTKKMPPSSHKDSLACPKMAEQAAMELLNAINEQRPFHRDLEAFSCLTKEQKIKLAEKAKKMIAEIKKKPSTQRSKYPQQRSLTRPFYLIPQHSFATRYLPIDTEVMLFYSI